MTDLNEQVLTNDTNGTHSGFKDDRPTWSYLHDLGEGLPLSGRLQAPLHGDQVQQLHLVPAGAAELQKEPLEDALGLVADGSTQEAQASRGLLPHLPQQLTAAETGWGTIWATTSRRVAVP